MTSVTILDGGMGKELSRIGAPFRQPEWSALALLEAPEFVRIAHQNFVDAGAEVIITNTYAVVPDHIGDERFERQGSDLASLAGRLAREVADASERSVQVAGSLPPLFGSYAPSAFEPEQAPALWQILIDALDPWVDLWLGETIGGLAELRSLLDLLSADKREQWMAFAISDRLVGGQAVLRTGESMADVARAVAPACDAVLFNCSQPETISAAIPALVGELDRLGAALPVGAYANAFETGAVEAGEYWSNEVTLGRRPELTPDAYGDIVAGWVDDGAVLVGGCCEMYPAHIAELTKRFGG